MYVIAYSFLLEPIRFFSMLNMYEFAQVQSINSMAECNWKGLFTRQRQPKAAAFVIKNRYEQLELIPTLFDNYF